MLAITCWSQRHRTSGLLSVLLALLFAGCGGAPAGRNENGGVAATGASSHGGSVSTLVRPSDASGPITITATTGMVAALAAEVGGSRVAVQALMGPGVDPHLYKATQGDLEKLSNAEIIFYSGLHLEGKMVDIFERMSRTRPTVAVTHLLDEARLRRPPEFAGNFDPHVWFDVAMWSDCSKAVEAELARYDPANAAEYQANGAALREGMATLDAWCREQIATIPREQRLMVTAHDAFGYFGRAYDIEVLGLQGISTVAEYGLQDLTRMVDTIVARKVRAVFVESSVPKKSIESLVSGCRDRGHPVTIGGQLFSDAMGAAGTPEGTYDGMVRHNVTTLVGALR
ncbi:MAG TPA: zinc ABC transporter substrate-binding protein [Candidatus Eisenbacteria bacterium]